MRVYLLVILGLGCFPLCALGDAGDILPSVNLLDLFSALRDVQPVILACSITEFKDMAPFPEDFPFDTFSGQYHFDLQCAFRNGRMEWYFTAWPIYCFPEEKPTYYIDHSLVIRVGFNGCQPGSEALPIWDDASVIYLPLLLEQLSNAQIRYNFDTAPHTYASDLDELSNGLQHAYVPYFDMQAAAGTRHGYTFKLEAGNRRDSAIGISYWAWSSAAWPINYGCETRQSYYVDESGVVRSADLGGTLGTIQMPDMPKPIGEKEAIETMFDIAQAQRDYYTNSAPHSFTSSFEYLCQGTGAGGIPYIEPELCDGKASGYIFDLCISEHVSYPFGSSYRFYSCSASPIVYGGKTRKSFYTSSTLPEGVILGEDRAGTAGDYNMPAVPQPIGERYAVETMLRIAEAQADFNANSTQHTYTDSFEALCEGDIRYLTPELLNGTASGYIFDLCVSDRFITPNGEIYRFYSCSAKPIRYQGETKRSFYISSELFHGAVLGEDRGGATGDSNMPFVPLPVREWYAIKAMLELHHAETDYNTNSYPHTFTDSFEALCTGTGAGDIPYIHPDLCDGEQSGYVFDLCISDRRVSHNGVSYWQYSCSAVPKVYGGKTRKSFYISVDYPGVVFGEDRQGEACDQNAVFYTNQFSRNALNEPWTLQFYNSPLKIDSQTQPLIQAAGYMNTALSENGGTLHIWAVAMNACESDWVELFYEGLRTGVTLSRQAPGYFYFTQDISQTLLRQKVLYELGVSGGIRPERRWPYLCVE